MPAIGSSDAHGESDRIGLPRTVVRAAALGVDAILAGIAAGTSWIGDPSGVTVDLTAASGHRTAGIGERLPAAPSDPVRVTARVDGAPSARLRLLTEQGQLHFAELGPDGRAEMSWMTTAASAGYVRLEVRHPRGAAGDAPILPYGPMAVMTNPILLAAPADTTADGTAPPLG